MRLPYLPLRMKNAIGVRPCAGPSYFSGTKKFHPVLSQSRRPSISCTEFPSWHSFDGFTIMKKISPSKKESFPRYLDDKVIWNALWKFCFFSAAQYYITCPIETLTSSIFLNPRWSEQCSCWSLLFRKGCDIPTSLPLGLHHATYISFVPVTS